MRPPEFWVLRALLHQHGKARGRPVNLDHCTPASMVAVLALVNTGDYVLLPDGTICEPVEVYVSQVDAEAEREKLALTYPAEDFRVIMNLDVAL